MKLLVSLRAALMLFAAVFMFALAGQAHADGTYLEVRAGIDATAFDDLDNAFEDVDGIFVVGIDTGGYRFEADYTVVNGGDDTLAGMAWADFSPIAGFTPSIGGGLGMPLEDITDQDFDRAFYIVGAGAAYPVGPVDLTLTYTYSQEFDGNNEDQSVMGGVRFRF